jgi:hypothetical protein
MQRRYAVWPFKKKVVKEIEGSAWGHLVSEHHIDVDTLHKEMRCVEREQNKEGHEPVIQLRIFKPAEVDQKGIEVKGWETFDEYPDLIHFEGYMNMYSNEAYLERKNT